jgi:hypothetical protein
MFTLGLSMRFALSTLAFAIVHFVLSFAFSFAAGISSTPGWKIASAILTFPINLIPGSFELPGIFTWTPWVLLSLLWGAGITALLRALLLRGT